MSEIQQVLERVQQADGIEYASEFGVNTVKAALDLLASSRIVEHNLDVDDPPTGHYVRWDNGLQVCARVWNQHPFEGLSYIVRDGTTIWQYPAAFTQLYYADVSGSPGHWGATSPDEGLQDWGGITLSPGTSDAPPSLTSARARYRYRIYGGRLDIMALAIGRWK